MKLTFRYVPMTPLFRQAMKGWLNGEHPGGPYTICQELKTKTKLRAGHEPLTKNEASHHFVHTLAGGKWEKVRGFHVFRHSFASNCAAKGIDPRAIDKWMGAPDRGHAAAL